MYSSTQNGCSNAAADMFVCGLCSISFHELGQFLQHKNTDCPSSVAGPSSAAASNIPASAVQSETPSRFLSHLQQDDAYDCGTSVTAPMPAGQVPAVLVASPAMAVGDGGGGNSVSANGFDANQNAHFMPAENAGVHAAYSNGVSMSDSTNPAAGQSACGYSFDSAVFSAACVSDPSHHQQHHQQQQQYAPNQAIAMQQETVEQQKLSLPLTTLLSEASVGLMLPTEVGNVGNVGALSQPGDPVVNCFIPNVNHYSAEQQPQQYSQDHTVVNYADSYNSVQQQNYQFYATATTVGDQHQLHLIPTYYNTSEDAAHYNNQHQLQQTAHQGQPSGSHEQQNVSTDSNGQFPTISLLPAEGSNPDPPTVNNNQRKATVLRSTDMQSSFICNVCQFVCKYQNQLTLHMRKHTGEKPYQCAVCGRSFSLKHNVRKHMNSHRVWPAVAAPTAADAGADAADAPSGSLTASNQSATPVPVDALVVRPSKSMSTAVRTKAYTMLESDILGRKLSEPLILVDSRHECRFCGQCFPDYHKLRSHLIQLHHQLKVYRCLLASCQFQCGTLDPFLKHLEQHRTAGELAYPCHRCGLQFPTLQQLALHDASHLPTPNERESGNELDEFVVEDGDAATPVAAAASTAAKNKRRHKQTSDVKPVIRCLECGTRFKNSRALKVHRHRVHRRTRCCPLCGRKFVSYDRLRAHLSTHTPPTNSSTAKLKTTARLRFVCPLCSNPYRLKAQLDYHVATSHAGAAASRLIDCPVADCSTRSQSQAHLKLHLMRRHRDRAFDVSVGNYDCDICSRRLYNRRGFIRHMRRHEQSEEQSGRRNAASAAASTCSQQQQRQTGPGPSVCPVCGRQYKRFDAFNLHIQNCRPSQAGAASSKPTNSSTGHRRSNRLRSKLTARDEQQQEQLELERQQGEAPAEPSVSGQTYHCLEPASSGNQPTVDLDDQHDNHQQLSFSGCSAGINHQLLAGDY